MRMLFPESTSSLLIRERTSARSAISGTFPLWGKTLYSVTNCSIPEKTPSDNVPLGGPPPARAPEYHISAATTRDSAIVIGNGPHLTGRQRTSNKYPDASDLRGSRVTQSHLAPNGTVIRWSNPLLSYPGSESRQPKGRSHSATRSARKSGWDESGR